MFSMERNWMLFMFFAFIVVSAGFVSIHDVRSEQREEENRVGGSSLEPVDMDTCSAAAQVAAQRVEPVYSCDSKQLDDFIVVDLGSKPLNDCISGCFPTDYRFVVRDGKSEFVGTRYGGDAAYVEGADDVNASTETIIGLDSLSDDASVSDLTRKLG